MSTPPRPEQVTTGPAHEAVCCSRPMSAISVTEVAGSCLALHSCPRCGRHLWHRDGVPLDRPGLLGAVRDRVAQVPAARPAADPGPMQTPPARATLEEVRERLAGFTVLGS